MAEYFDLLYRIYIGHAEMQTASIEVNAFDYGTNILIDCQAQLPKFTSKTGVNNKYL